MKKNRNNQAWKSSYNQPISNKMHVAHKIIASHHIDYNNLAPLPTRGRFTHCYCYVSCFSSPPQCYCGRQLEIIWKVQRGVAYWASAPHFDASVMLILLLNCYDWTSVHDPCQSRSLSFPPAMPTYTAASALSSIYRSACYAHSSFCFPPHLPGSPLQGSLLMI
jgi:hypothetical protein